MSCFVGRMEMRSMAETAGGVLEQGIVHVYLRGSPYRVLLPEGDGHRLVRPSPPAGGGFATHGSAEAQT